MRYYAAGLLGIAVLAEALGLGGVPAQAVELENMLFTLLLITLIVTVLRRFMQR